MLGTKAGSSATVPTGHIFSTIIFELTIVIIILSVW